MTRPQNIAYCAAFAVLLAFRPAVEWVGAAVTLFDLHPLAYLGLLTALGVAAGAGCGRVGRGIAAEVTAAGDPPPLSGGRVRGMAVVAAAGTAGLAAIFLSHEVRTRRFAEQHRRLLEENPLAFHTPPWSRESAPAAEVALQDARYGAGVDSLFRRDTALRDLADRAGLDLPDWLSRGVDQAVPIFVASLAAAVAWRLSRPAEPDGDAPR